MHRTLGSVSSVVVATHDRCYDRGQVIEDSSHLESLAAAKRHARDLRGRDLLRNSCSAATAWIEALAARDEPIATHITKLNRLLETYGPKALNEALSDTLTRGAVSAASVAHVLDHKARALNQLPPLPVILPNDPRVRDLDIKQHLLSSYDSLSNNLNEE